jgi:hypothetical protein
MTVEHRPTLSGFPTSTLDHLESSRQDVVGLWGRRGFLALMALVLVAALVGLLGVRSTTTAASAQGWTLQLKYAAIARAGWDVPFTATVEHPGGFGKQVTLALTGTYLDIYETQGFNPDPSEATRDGDTLYLTFDAPTEGDTFRVTYDAYIQPSSQQGRTGTLSVVDDHEHRIVSVHLHTRLLP